MDNKFELIERYLSGDMSVQEQEEFEKMLRTDQELMSEFQLRKEIDNAINEDDIMSLRHSLEEIANETPVKTRRIYIYSGVAAAVILLLVILNIDLFRFGKLDRSEIIEQYYTAYPPVMNSRSSASETEIENSLNKAFQLYSDTKFEEAAGYFENACKMDSSNVISKFYLSICYIEVNNLVQAEKHLNDLVLKQDHILWEQSNWYLAMIYLKQNKIEKAKNVLNKIIEEDMVQKEDAETILDNLN